MLDFSETFEQWLREKRLSDKTIEEYLYYNKKFLQLGNLNQSNVILFLSHYNNNVARAYLKNVIPFFKFNPLVAEENGLSMNDIRMIEIPLVTGRAKVRIPKVISEYEVEKIGEKMSSPKFRLMLYLTFEAGLRRGELLTISLQRIRFEKWSKNPNGYGEIIVLGKGNKEGIALVNPYVMKALYRYVKAQNFKEEEATKPIWGRCKRALWHRELTDASIKALGFPVNPHLLRHSRATDLLRKGMKIEEIKEFLRHSSINSTQIYIHMDREDLKNRLAQVESNS